jgi:hypothetical protein
MRETVDLSLSSFTSECVIKDNYAYILFEDTGLFALDVSYFTESIEETDYINPDTYELYCYPNPFNSTINIDNPTASPTEIYDISGKLIHTLPIGRNTWSPDASVKSGIYIVKSGGIVGERVVYLK